VATAVTTDMATVVEVEDTEVATTVPDETMMTVTAEDTDVIVMTMDLVSIGTVAVEDATTATEATDEVEATAAGGVTTDPMTEVETAAMVLHQLNMVTQLLVERPRINLMVAATQMRETILVAIKC